MMTAEADSKAIPLHNTKPKWHCWRYPGEQCGYAKVTGPRAEHFFDALHARIYAAIGKLIERVQWPITSR